MDRKNERYKKGEAIFFLFLGQTDRIRISPGPLDILICFFSGPLDIEFLVKKQGEPIETGKTAPRGPHLDSIFHRQHWDASKNIFHLKYWASQWHLCKIGHSSSLTNRSIPRYQFYFGEKFLVSSLHFLKNRHSTLKLLWVYCLTLNLFI